VLIIMLDWMSSAQLPTVVLTKKQSCTLTLKVHEALCEVYSRKHKMLKEGGVPGGGGGG
jgi:hypothetical protein